MNTIKRDVYVLRNTIKIPIEVTKGTDMVGIEFTVRDFDIPATAAAVAYSYNKKMKKPNSQLCDVSDNVISFAPERKFFEVGMNELQIRVINEDKALISFKEKVKCSDAMGFPDDEEEKQQTLIEQLVFNSEKETGERKKADETERNERTAAIEKEKSERMQADATEKSQRKAEIDVERKRINNLAKLPAGSTKGDAELKDIRVGADGTIYETAGEAVRQQVDSLKKYINDLKSSSANNESLIYDILSKGTYTEDISPLMSQLDGLVHDGMYKITSDVKNATLSNKRNYVTKGSRYKCTVTASIGYKIYAVVVTMGGVDISSSNYDTTTKTITIESVTGPINITITTIETIYTALQYIKGDGNSWIDTGVVANVNHRYELSAKLDGDDATEYFFGADQYNVGSAYKQFYLTAIANHAGIMGTINGKGNVDVGTWNTTEHNLLSNKKMYLVVKNGSQEIYLNSDYTEKQTNYKAGSASFGAQDTLPIIPLYLFHVNTTESTNQNNARGYKRSKITVYWLKIYDDTTNEMLHEFLPVAKNGKIGMLDTVTKEFHANIGTGTFAYEEA